MVRIFCGMKEFDEYKELLKRLYELGEEIIEKNDEEELIPDTYADEVNTMQYHIGVCMQYLDIMKI